jgi:hypothetical protein
LQADPTQAILAYVRHVGAGLDPDFLREAVRVMPALLMEVEVKQQIGVDRYERTEERTTYRNGYRALSFFSLEVYVGMAHTRCKALFTSSMKTDIGPEHEEHGSVTQRSAVERRIRFIGRMVAPNIERHVKAN